MSTPRLSPTSYLVLGLIEMMGSSTPYDLKRMVSQTVGHFWSFPHSQLYSEPARLGKEGLLTEEREKGGRHKRIYAITDAGRRALRGWLAKPVTEPYELRELASLKLFFGNLARPEDTIALARTQEGLYRNRLAQFEQLEAVLQLQPGFAHQLAVLRGGMMVERALLKFWSELAQSPPGTGPSPAGARRKTRRPA